MLRGKKILLGVTGGIAAYKAAQLCRDLLRAGAAVRVIMTRHARRFVAPLTFEAISGRPALTSLFAPGAVAAEHAMEHIDHSRWGELLIVAPATANCIGKFAHGVADDALTTIYLALPAPVLLAPAMNPRMWAHPAVRENCRLLRERRVVFVGPAAGELACGDQGEGRMAEPAEIIRAAAELLNPRSPLCGKRVLITAGPTREYLDPVRFISNPSSGRMGFALAEECQARGARTTLIAGPVALEINSGVQRINVQSAEQMLNAALEHWREQDVLIFSAAVGDYTPREPRAEKIKKSAQTLTVDLTLTADIARTIGRLAAADAQQRRVLVGFAAETENLEANAREKLRDKQLDLIVGNDLRQPGGVFGQEANQAHLFFKNGENLTLARLDKAELAREIFDQIERLLAVNSEQ